MKCVEVYKELYHQEPFDVAFCPYRIMDNGCGYDAPGSFAAWLSKQTPMHAFLMPGKRYDIGDINSYEYVKNVFSK